MKQLGFLLIFLLAVHSTLAGMTADEIVRKVDDEMERSGSLTQIEMKVYRREKLRKTYRMISRSEGNRKMLVEFLYPPRNRGEKFLKVEKNMWIYRPKINKVIRISGRSSFSGSDFSNTDLLSVRLDRDYNARLIGIEDYKGKPAYKLELQAKSEAVTYAKIIYWIDKEGLVPLKRDFYTLSGHLLKTLLLEVHSDIFRGMPDTFVMFNVLEKNKKSVMVFKSYKPNQSFPARTFRKSSLKKKR